MNTPLCIEVQNQGYILVNSRWGNRNNHVKDNIYGSDRTVIKKVLIIIKPLFIMTTIIVLTKGIPIQNVIQHVLNIVTPYINNDIFLKKT